MVASVMLRACVFGSTLLGACSSASEQGCEQDGECVLGGTPGICQPEGVCSYPDPTCPSGLSFPVTAGSTLGGACVPGDGGDGEPSSAGPMSATATAVGDDVMTSSESSSGSTDSGGDTTESDSTTDSSSGSSSTGDDTTGSSSTDTGTTDSSE